MGYRHCRTDILAMADDYTAFSNRKTLSVLQSPLESRLLLKLQGNKSSVKMSSAPEPPAFKKEPPKEKDFQNPGLRGVRTTTLFRAVNPELFIKPNKPVMAFGLVTLSLCVAYIGYLHATQENKNNLYEAIDSEGHSYMRRKTSKWD
ncbi:small integral membrane protein 8 isoform X2 [Oryctolagus cuniculus]|uniref:small integral membrane protein 8 isoform X2 n=1 Tax=Oryctolagus cuniculus TaxID=9986 RepID=UPI0038793B82